MILQEARQLGYRKETRNIAILISDYSFTSYFGYVMQPLCYELQKRDFIPVIVHVENIAVLEELSFCAVVSLMAENKLEKYWNNFHSMPLICINTRSRHLDQAYMVASDDAHGIEMIINHLVLMGHSKIGRICPQDALNAENWNQNARSQIFQQILSRYGLHDRYSIYQTGNGSPEALKNLVKQGITALFIQQENSEAIILRNLKLLDIRVPEDLSVVSLSFPNVAAYTDPPLTSIVQNYGLISSETGIMLERLLTESASPQDVYVPYQFYDYSVSVRNLNRTFCAR